MAPSDGPHPPPSTTVGLITFAVSCLLARGVSIVIAFAIAPAALQAYRHVRGPLVLYRKDGNPMPEYTLRDLLIRVGRIANLRHSGPHMLRHTFCSHLIMRGALVTAVKELAGHRDSSTTMRSIHLAPSVLTDAIALLNGRGMTLHSGDIVETAQG